MTTRVGGTAAGRRRADFSRPVPQPTAESIRTDTFAPLHSSSPLWGTGDRADAAGHVDQRTDTEEKKRFPGQIPTPTKEKSGVRVLGAGALSWMRLPGPPCSTNNLA